MNTPVAANPVCGADETPSLRLAFRDWFGLTATEADVLTVLYRAAPAPLDREQLARRTGSSSGAISVHLVQIRRALEAEAVETLAGAGYVLTPTGLAECRAAVVSIADALRGCVP